jgi:hypothetical protein
MPETKMLVMLGQGKTIAQRKDLFRALDETIMDELSRGKLNQEVAKILRSMTTDERRAVMLTAVEGFSIFETAEILCTSTSFVEEALTNAETSLRSALATTGSGDLHHSLPQAVADRGKFRAGLPDPETVPSPPGPRYGRTGGHGGVSGRTALAAPGRPRLPRQRPLSPEHVWLHKRYS